jgi:tetratricopeptide (TPR) repeat protein
MKEQLTEGNNPIIKTGSTSLVKADNVIQVTNKLLYSEIENLFNEAFYLINSQNIERGTENFLLLLTSNYNNLRSRRFKYNPKTFKDSIKATEIFKKIIEIKPSFAYAYNYCGFAYWDLGEISKAVKMHTKAIELDPNYADAYYYRMRPEEQLGNYDEALRDLKKSISLYKKNHIIDYLYLGNLISHLEKNFNAAIEAYNKAISLKPNFTEAYFQRGNAELSLKKYKKAIKSYSAAIDIWENPNKPAFTPKDDKGEKLRFKCNVVYLQRSKAKRLLGDFRGAKEDQRVYKKNEIENNAI